jgi:branched-subunit amino acid ABC-type transport system permease component
MGRIVTVLLAALLGAVIGGIVGFVIGVALGPGPETGGMYGLNQAASGMTVGAIGLVVGAFLGGIAAAIGSRHERTSDHSRRPPRSSPI